MGLWSEKVKQSQAAMAAAKSAAADKAVDWQERHFQICLALMGRTDLDSRNPEAIIMCADKMVAALKEHYK